MERLRIVGFYGYGPASAGVRRNTRLLVEGLRELGFIVEYSEVTVPAVDFDEFEPFVKVNGEEVYIPSVSVDQDTLIDYFLSTALMARVAPLPLPPAVTSV